MFKFPALYNAASEISKGSQEKYLRLIKGEFFLLFLASILALDLSNRPLYFVFYAFIFLASLVITSVRSWLKPEQDWYKGRALAESIKTSCWRYCMRAEPFGDADSVAIRGAEFRNHLKAILDANHFIGERVPPDSAAEGQITPSMEATRALPIDERKAFYEEHRIRDQRKWYAKKAGGNRLAARYWAYGSVVAYASAIFLVLLRIAYPEWEIWPIEPLIVIATSIVGWTQVKKFNELASSYTLTAHEILIVQGRLADIGSDEGEFSEFVNEAEQAFSREHTQWVARQQTQ